MKLNHLNLTVTDVPATVALLEAHFGLTRAAGMPGNAHMAFLRDDGGFLLSLFRASDVQYPGMFHIGFVQDTPEEVRAIHARLSAAGYAPEPMREEHGRLTFYFPSGTGLQIEVDAFLR